MTGVRFLFRVTLRRLELAAEIYHIKQPQKIPLVLSPDEAKRLLAMSENLKVRVLLALSYGAGLRAGEVVQLKAGDIDSAQNIVRIVQAKGRKDRHVMLSPETLALPRQWWKVRPTRFDAGVAQEQRLLFPDAIFSCRLHAASPHRGHRVSEQGCHLRYPVQSIGRDHDHDRRRSKTAGRPDRAGPGCLNRSPRKLSGFLPGLLGCGASRVWRDARRA